MSQEQSGMEKWDNDLGSLTEEMVIIAPESQHFPLLILLMPLCLLWPRTHKFKHMDTTFKSLHTFFHPIVIF